jgi:hypothetical protein
MATLAIAAVGALGAKIAGFGATGMAIGWSIGAYVGQLLFGSETKISGPRLDDLSVQTASPGASIPDIYGSVRVGGNLIWAIDLIERSKEEDAGGKGGGAEYTTYTYFATFAIGLCEGEIIGVRKIWLDGKLFADFSGDDFFDLYKSQEQFGDYFTVYKGTETQTADATIEAQEGTGDVPGFRGLAYIVFDELPLADYGNHIPNVTAEVVKTGNESNQNWVFDTPGVSPFGLAVTIDGSLISTDGGTKEIYFHDGISETIITQFGIDTNTYASLEDVTVFKGNVYAVQSIIAGNSYIVKYDGFTPRIIDHFSTGTNYANGICNDGTDMFFAVNHPTTDEIKWLAGDGGDFDNPQYVGSIPSLASADGEELWGICIDDDGNLIESSRSNSGMLYRHEGLTGTQKDTLDLLTPHNIQDMEAIEWYDGNLIVIAQNLDQIWIFDGFTSNVISVTSITRTDPDLETIIEAICADCDLASGVIDASDCSATTIKGYIRSHIMTGRQALEPLMVKYQVDAAEIDHKIKFIIRNNASEVNIPTNDIAAHTAGSAMPDEISIKREQETDFPREVNVTYMDLNRDYETNMQRSIRMTSNSKQVFKTELPLVLTRNQAKQMAEILHGILDIERTTYRFETFLEYLYLAPTDVIEINSMKMRIASMNIAGGMLQIEGPAEEDGTYEVYGEAEDPGWTDQGILIRGPTAYVFLDIPILRDADDDAGFYVAVHGYYTNWPGATVFYSPDGGATWNSVLGISAASVVGYTTNALAAADAGKWDRTNTVNIKLGNTDSMSLSSITELATLNGGNAAAIGSHGNWEIIGFKDAVLQSDGTYTLSNLIRGRRGSDWATGAHAIGDTFVLLDENTLRRYALGADQIGNSLQYKIATWGQNLSEVSIHNFTNNAVSLECYSVADVAGSRDGSNNLTITWKRRTRIGGEWRDNVGPRLGEDSESYEIDVLGGSPEAVLRTITATSETASYTAAQQTTDGLTPGDPVHIKIYQLSADVSRGYVEDVTI